MLLGFFTLGSHIYIRLSLTVMHVFVGHVGVSFYFIVSGTVTVQREEKDDRTREKHVQVYLSA